MQDAWFVLPSLPVGDEADSWSLDGPELALHDYLKASRATRISVGKVKGDLAASGATGEQLAALLARLSEMGYLRFVGAPFDEVTMSELTTLSASALLGGRANYFSFLGVPQRASKKVVDAAVLEASRKWHPDALVGRHPRVQALGSKLFTLLREAADIVGDLDSRQAYIEDLADGQLGRGGQDRERARILLAKGRISLKGKHYAEAAREFEAAAASDPTLFIARVLSQWAGFLGNPGGAETSIAALQSLGREADAPPELWHFLGRMYLYVHNKDRARRCFEKVLKLDPENRDSQRQLRLLVQRSGGEQSPSKKGFWSRLRGR
jgi:curved DNA-binding protein CbpA